MCDQATSIITGPLNITNIPSEVEVIEITATKVTNISVDMFDGLAALTRLWLFSNQLMTLPTGVFDTNTALTELRLSTNKLTTLPAGVFDKLTALTDLRLSTNKLTTLPAGVFDKNTALTQLRLDDNRLTTLPAGVFDGLTKLTQLRLDDNQLTTLPAGMFDKNTKLSTLNLNGNPLTLSSHTCMKGFYRTQVSLLGNTFFACDPCTISGETKAITCWNHLGQDNTASNHPPTVCPRGSYCNRTTLNEYLCPEGTYNYRLGSDSADDCEPCESGSFNPIPGSTSCEFKCSPGKYGNKRGGVEEETACTDCPDDKTSSLGASHVSQCVAGPPLPCDQGFGWYRGSKGCEKCPPGTYGDGSMCKLCALGTTQPQSGQGTCLSNCPQKAACQYFPGGSSHAFPKGTAYQTTPEENQHKDYISGGTQLRYPFRAQEIAFFLSMLLPAFGMILGHRCFPAGFRHLDVLFSRKHLLNDTHAVRGTKSRLGAACTVAFAFFSIILLYDGYYQANELVSSSLLYATSDEMKPHKDRSFGELVLRADFLSDLQCASVTTDISPFLDCKKESCEWRCKTTSLSNAHISFTLPKTTQAFAWNMSVTSWEFQREGEENYHLKMSMAGVIGPSRNKVLSGDSDNPTDIQIELLRGFSLYNMGVKRESSGLKILYQLMRRIEEPIASATNGEDSHVVRFLLPVSNLVVFEQTAEKLSFQARLTLALSLMTSMMAVMSIGKMVLGFAIDKYYLRSENVPEDVARRQVILRESIITRGGSRRMSSYVDKNKAPPPIRTTLNPLYGVELKNIRTSEKNVHNKL
eukprot:g2327.t1